MFSGSPCPGSFRKLLLPGSIGSLGNRIGNHIVLHRRTLSLEISLYERSGQSDNLKTITLTKTESSNNFSKGILGRNCIMAPLRLEVRGICRQQINTTYYFIEKYKKVLATKEAVHSHLLHLFKREKMSEEDTSQFHVSEPLHSQLPDLCGSLITGKLIKENIIDMLDEVERHVERMRREAVQLEEEKDTIFTTLDTLKHSHMMEDLSASEKDDIERYADRIMARCSTIEVFVRTVRDSTQEDSLHQINKFIDNMVKEIKNDPAATKMKCISFMNSCSSYCENGVEDKNFERALLGCTVDDQKRVRRRLQGLMGYIEKLNIP